jgi:chemotaxis protein MotB
MYGHTKQLIALVVGAVQQLPQQIAIKGHTDSTPYVSTTGYSNWELSTDRANSSRRALVESGLNPERIASVVGRADQEHLDEDDPESPRNRRISIILLRESAVTGPSTAKAPGGGPAGTAN